MRKNTSGKTSETCRVFVIDDHPLMRAGMAKLIETEPGMELCGELGEGRGAYDLVLKAKPDVILLDLSLKDSSGLELIKDFRAGDIQCPVLVVSMHDEALYAERVLKAGANGYLMKEEAGEKVLEGISVVLSGELFLSEKMKKELLGRLVGGSSTQSNGRSLKDLTDREFEIFELIGRGKSTRVIAEGLSISPKTVDAHRANMKEKLNFTSGAELLRYAVRWIESGMKSRT